MHHNAALAAIMSRTDPVKILCLTKDFKNHSASGGYEQVSNYIGTDVVGRPSIHSLPMRLIEKGWHFSFGNKPHLFSNLGHGYHFEDRLAEEHAFWRAALYRPDILHVLYGDWMLDTLLRRERFMAADL